MEGLGFVPNLFKAQSLLPRLVEAEVDLAAAVLLKPSALSRIQKECILLVLSAAHRNEYCACAHSRLLLTLGMPAERVRGIVADHQSAGLPEPERELLDFCLLLGLKPSAVQRRDIEALRRRGFSDEQILEAVLMTSLTSFLCTLSSGLGAKPDFPECKPALGPAARERAPRPAAADAAFGDEAPAAYLRSVDLEPQRFPPFAFFKDRFGFVPNIFRAQTLRPDVLEAEARVVGTVLLSDDVLSRARKEYILLAVSAANLNTYCVAVHCEMLRALGIPEEVSDRVAVDHRSAGLPPADAALLDFALKLTRQPRSFWRGDVEALRAHGFSDTQILEAVVMTALTQFLNTLQMGLAPVPDFHPRLVFAPEPFPSASGTGVWEGDPKNPNRGEGAAYPISEGQAGGGSPGGESDADAGDVGRVRGGNLGAFEAIVLRHQGRVYRTLMAITGNPEDAEDGAQSAFLKAFEHLGTFQGNSRFSTWLTRIAINEGIQRLRARRAQSGLDEEAGEEEFRPRLLQAWEESPEQIYSRAELRGLVEKELLKLPASYRLAVLLRDVEQMSNKEAAAALDLPLANLKTRVVRGRLMLREALAPHFTRRRDGGERA